MTRNSATLAAFSAAITFFSAANIMAQEQASRGQSEMTGSAPVLDGSDGSSMVVDGRVVGIERRPDLVVLLTLDNGMQLTVPQPSKRPSDDPTVGGTVVGRYIENGADKIATSLRVIEAQAP